MRIKKDNQTVTGTINTWTMRRTYFAISMDVCRRKSNACGDRCTHDDENKVGQWVTHGVEDEIITKTAIARATERPRSSRQRASQKLSTAPFESKFNFLEFGGVGMRFNGHPLNPWRSLKIYRKSIEHQSKIYRKSIEHLSNIDRTSIEHLSKIDRASIENLRTSTTIGEKIWSSMNISRNL